MHNMKRLMLFILGAGLTLIIIAVAFGMPFERHSAAGAEITLEEHVQQYTPQEGPDIGKEITGDNGFCLLCHSKEGRTLDLPDGQLNLHITGETLANSVHGVDNPEGALGCIDCHGERSFPHEQISPASEREYSLNMAQICTECHVEQAEALIDGVHADGFARGNLRSATCTDCHGSHDVQPIEDNLALASQTCGECHAIVYEEYADSIHGKALLEEDDPNVPGCTTCHGVHSGIDHPTAAEARNSSPELCAECHADEKLMKEYGISTNVFNSYLNDFHGTTQALFEQDGTEVATNKAVCYDCHGVHNITPADDSKSQVAKENLLATCQQCHPNATADFPDAWVGHFEPSAEDNPVLFGVDWFYKILIPMVIGGFVILVASDIFARARVRITGSGHGHAATESDDEEGGE